VSDPGRPPPPGHLVEGRVVDFDEAVGLGWVASDAAGTRYRLHCTSIAGGSRTIPVGTAVTFAVVAAHGGQWEAADVRPRG